MCRPDEVQRFSRQLKPGLMDVDRSVAHSFMGRPLPASNDSAFPAAINSATRDAHHQFRFIPTRANR
jgi:hypothetical protein